MSTHGRFKQGRWILAAVTGVALFAGACTATSANANRERESSCERFEGVGCYWMENSTGRYCWVPAEWAESQADCFAADSCSGGLGRSGGGCYKWASGSDAKAEPWNR